MKHQTKLLYGLAMTFSLLWSAGPAFGLILHTSGEPNIASWTDRPPAEVIGRWGYSGSCVVISPDCVITTRHQGGGLYTSVEIGGVKYTVSNIWDHNTADLRIAKLRGANLTRFVGIYENTDEVGKDVVIGGYGLGRGEILQKLGITYGYGWNNGGNTTLRLGTNRIEETESDSTIEDYTSDVVIADFDGLNEGQAVIYESIPASYDSGGGWFIKAGNKWKAAGLSRAVTMHFEEGHENDPNYAIYEAWFRDRADPNTPLSDYMDAVRISSYAQWIKGVFRKESPADLNGDGYIGLGDFAIFAQHWAETNCQGPDWCSGADLKGDGYIDYEDLAEFAKQWLQEE